jgi:hypothetical protein
MARSTLGWAFGLAVSVLLLAVWGRAVVVDTATLAESLAPLATSSQVTGYLTTWVEEEMVADGADPDGVDDEVGRLFISPAVARTLDNLVVELVTAAASTDPNGSAVDVAGVVAPSVPDLSSGMAQLGYPVTEAEVSDVVASMEPLVVREPGAPALVGPNSVTATRLGTAALLAVLALLGLGYGFVSLSEDRLSAVRSLLTRVALGGLSFAIFLKLGSWVLDPSGGRAPVQASISAVAGSKWAVPLALAVAAAAVAGIVYLVRRRLRPFGPDGPDGRFEDTDERPLSLIGSG